MEIQAKIKEHRKSKRQRQKKKKKKKEIQLLLFLLTEELVCLAATKACPEQSKGRDIGAL